MTREEAIEILWRYDVNFEPHPAEKVMHAIDMAIESLSADEEKENGTFVNRDNYTFNCNDSNRTLVEPKWITDSKPTEDGTYMVTLEAFGQHRYIRLRHYGKPLLPNRDVKGVCWYRTDDEGYDVVYDDDEILAWLPLPTPYGERKEE